MKDLRVLEQQQHESQRKLQHAQETKQRRIEYHATLETNLEQVKYQNGQNRAELSHMHNLLSKGQRSLGTRIEIKESSDSEVGGMKRHVWLLVGRVISVTLIGNSS
jgi:hypothetical protein